MPIYEFQCNSCGLRFERLYRKYSEDTEVPCECGNQAKKLVSAVSFSFAHTPVGGPRPQNTGVHSIDYNPDQVIGRDAARRWEEMEKRGEVKDRHIRDERKAGRVVTREQLVPKSDGEGYRTITEPERVRVNENRDAAFRIAQATKSKKSDS